MNYPLSSLPTRPSRTAACVAACKQRIADAKTAVWRQFSHILETHGHVLELALNEAEALAWQSGYPQLVFPDLALEKARAVAAWHARQELIQGKNALAA
ncbi:MAG: hypothetical protein U1G07_02785 [Verrucomicrobiota bacterium]